MLYTYVFTAIVSGAIAFSGAWKVQDWRYGAQEAQRLQKLREDTNRQDKRSYDASADFEKAKENVRTIFKTIEIRVIEEVEKPIYREQCFADSGVSLLNDGIGQTATSQSSGTMSNPK